MPARTLKMARNPTFKAVGIRDIIGKYGAVNFIDALADFIAGINNPGASMQELLRRSEDTLIPFGRVPVYHNMKFMKTGDGGQSEVIDVVHAWPEQQDSCGQIIPSCFDTVLVQGSAAHAQGNKGNRLVNSTKASVLLISTQVTESLKFVQSSKFQVGPFKKCF